MSLTPEQVEAGWVEHDGGPMPVPGDTMIDFVMRCETVENHRPVSEAADDCDWSWNDEMHDIIAYRPEPKP